MSKEESGSRKKEGEGVDHYGPDNPLAAQLLGNVSDQQRDKIGRAVCALLRNIKSKQPDLKKPVMVRA